jgi:hypothetical protein
VALLRPYNLAAQVGVGVFQNAGDLRMDPKSGPVSIGPPDTNRIIDTLNFLKSIRGDLGLSKDLPPGFLEQCAKTAAGAFPS